MTLSTLASKNTINTVLKSLKEAFWSVYNGIATFFGGGIVIFTAKYYDGIGFLSSFFYGVLIYGVCFFLFLNYRLVKNFSHLNYQLGNDNIYGEAIKYMNAAFAIIHELQRKNTKNSNEVLLYLTAFCTQVQSFFEKKAQADCSVSIKLMVYEQSSSGKEKLEVITLCRDRHNIGRREPQNNTIKHYVHNNTCFSKIVELLPRNEGRYYLNNDLVADSGYENSSSQYYGALPNRRNYDDRAKEWPLPYKSELVAPIMPIKESEKQLIKGFFCVDCVNSNAFNDKYDPDLVLGIADGLFNILKKYTRLLNKR